MWVWVVGVMAVQYSTMRCNTVHCSAIQRSAVQHTVQRVPLTKKTSSAVGMLCTTAWSTSPNPSCASLDSNAAAASPCNLGKFKSPRISSTWSKCSAFKKERNCPWFTPPVSSGFISSGTKAWFSSASFASSSSFAGIRSCAACGSK